MGSRRCRQSGKRRGADSVVLLCGRLFDATASAVVFEGALKALKAEGEERYRGRTGKAAGVQYSISLH